MLSKICQIEENLIKFEDGTYIECFHSQDCCEHNYADFEQLDDIARNTKFNTSKLVVEPLDGQGFRFGNKPFKMFFVPCYSRQNGYYSTCLNINVNGQVEHEITCEEDFSY